MRIYLDSCTIQRPLDDQTQPRIRVETEAVMAVLMAADAGDVVLLNSEALEYETARIPNAQRRTEAVAILALARERLEISDEAEALALILEDGGISPMDALHLALASTAQADCFVTCDDKLLRKASVLTNIHCRVVSVLNLFAEIIQ